MVKNRFIDFDLQDRSRRCIAQNALTNSKRPSTFVEGVYPTHLKRGQGCFVWDVEGKRYCDFVCGLGSNLMGYGNNEIVGAITQAALDGLSLSLGSELEVEYAEKIKGLFPWVDHVKLLKTGTEACMAAVRIARAYTGKDYLVSEGYHGWSDEFVALTPPALGCRDGHAIMKLKENTLDCLSVANNVSAVIVEPIVTDHSEERINFLKALRQKCTEMGVLLIFDEVITGFRFPKWSASNYYGIEPDIICLGKSIAGGMPLSIVAGKKAVMNDVEYFVSSTFAGERASIAAGLKTIELLRSKHKIDELWEQGERFLSKFNALWPDAIKIEGYPTRGVFKGDEIIKALFWQESVKAGILFGPSWFFNFHHIPLIDEVINSSKDILTRIKTGMVKLEGKLPKKPFAQEQRETKNG